jgi:hypothetical protein
VELGLRESLDAFIRVLEAALHTPEKELVHEALRDLGPRAIGAVERYRELLVELRTIIGERGPYPSNSSIGRPSGLVGDFTTPGGTAAISTTFETRFVPCRPR